MRAPGIHDDVSLGIEAVLFQNYYNFAEICGARDRRRYLHRVVFIHMGQISPWFNCNSFVIGA